MPPVNLPTINLLSLTPVLVMALTVIVVMLADLVIPARSKNGLALIGLAGLAAAALSAVAIWNTNQSAFNNGVLADNYGLFLSLVILLAAAIAILLSLNFVQVRGLQIGEYLALMLASVSGMCLMTVGNDLIVIFLALEILSLSLYILSGFWRKSGASLEAGMKYFLLGAFSSAFFLYGIAFVYGAAGTTNLTRVATALALTQAYAGNNTLLLIGAGLLIVGFGFKVALVPFQWWTPDVYEGAPTPITAFMSVATKTAAFAAFFRTFVIALPIAAWDWRLVLAIVAVLTMSVGNIAALVQTNIKRMLAYSSIAHAGYVLIALVAAGSSPQDLRDSAISAALFYLLAYTVMNLGAFGAVIAMGDGERERTALADLSGAAAGKPLAAAALAICLLSLAGFPPFAGFVGKFFVFSAAINTGWAWLAIVGVLNSLVSVYFYLGPVIRMYMSAPAEGWATARTPFLVGLAVAIAVIATIGLGLIPASALSFAQAAIIK
ncbi:MAG: NADH-quinone oxidoreductase subunit N [Anaerolineae bacterium]